MKGGLKLSGKLIQLSLLFGILFSYTMFQGGFVSGFLFYAFLPVFCYFLIFLLYPLSTWKVKRTLSRNVTQAGNSVEVTIDLERKIGMFLPYLIIEDCFSASLEPIYQSNMVWKKVNDKAQPRKTENKQAVFPLFKRKIRLSYRFTDLPRGAHHFDKVMIKTSDIFGFMEKTATFSVENSIVVYPEKKEIAIKKQRNNFEEGAKASYSLQSRNTHVVTGVREYMPGDRFSWIDWKTTARKQSLMTKEFEQEKSTDGFLVLDTSYSESFNGMGVEASVVLARSIVHYFDRKSTNIGLLSLGSEVAYFPPQQASMKEMLHYQLATLKPHKNGRFAMKLTEHINQMPSNLFILILTTEVDHALVQALKQVQQKSKQIIIYISKPSYLLSEEDNRLIQQMRLGGMIVDVITEDVLRQDVIEVSM
ncbi:MULTISPECIES: DUF58 domain-containing protein [Paraliobacillus]|uniref:DUF58 domain-containing protein n=1 Tax=Paraliobacillus TaxID=200903 RepID=UPI000DD46978|nr:MULTISPECIES: DUF58 domain-containing protein [Paraliobacillus]